MIRTHSPIRGAAFAVGLASLAHLQAGAADDPGKAAATAAEEGSAGSDVHLFEAENLVAWCIVPFDAAKRGPAERAAMLERLGFTKCAYDWREEHVPTFEEEILEYRKRGIEFFAFWDAHPAAFELFRRHDLHPQVWKIGPSPEAGTQEARVTAAAEALEPLARETAALGCPLGLYNHGGWSGEPENLVAVCRALRARGHDHVGIVYNLHHAHPRIATFRDDLALMRPFLLCLNLNGMNDDGDPKILPIGRGKHDADLLGIIVDSGFDGPIGILDHRSELDAEESLRQNLEGLRKLRPAAAKP